MCASFVSWTTCQATPEEDRRTLPGDAFIAHPVVSLTYAITIEVPPDRVWPWLVQMGCGRAGWYSYDWLDNGGRPSATTIDPAWQQVAIGDVLPGAPGMREAFVVIDVVPARMLLLGVPAEHREPTPAYEARADMSVSAAGTAGMGMTWCFVLDETTAQRTRLLTRARVAEALVSPASRTPLFAPVRSPSEVFYRIPFPRLLWRVLAIVIHYIMQHKQLVQIKQRAEHEAVAVHPAQDADASDAADLTAGAPMSTGKQ